MWNESNKHVWHAKTDRNISKMETFLNGIQLHVQTSDSCIYSFLFVCFLLFCLVFFFFAKTCEPWGSGVNWTCYFVSCCLLSFSQRTVISRSNLNRSASSNHGPRSGIWHFEPYIHVFRERCGRCLKATNQWRLCNTKARMLSRSALNMFWSCRL